MKRITLLATLLAALAFTATAGASFTQELGSPVGVGASPYDVVAADFNRDGRPDLAVANGTAGTISILLRQPGGGFAEEGAPLAAGPGATALAVADFNSDTRLDLASANFGGTGTVFLRNPITGFSQEGPSISLPAIKSIATGDFNADTQPDLVFGSNSSDAIYVFLRNAGPGFTQEGTEITTAGHKVDLVTADFNLDGRSDIASANESAATVSVFQRQGIGGFAVSEPTSVGKRPLGIVAGDFNGDGRVDLAASSYESSAVTLLLGQLSGTFVPEAGSPYPVGVGPIGMTTGDFNRDGALDLAVANGVGKSVSVLLRSGTGFVPDPSSPIPTGQIATSNVAAADFDGDGRTDLAASNQGSNNVTVLLNTTPPAAGPPAPASVAKYPRLARKIRFAQTTDSDYTQFTALSVKPVKKGDRITIKCKGGGCELKKKAIEIKKNKPSLSILRQLGNAKLQKGAVLEVWVTRPATIGPAKRWQIRPPKKPLVRSRCLVPGKKKPVVCP